jgi:hypothetical protein
VEAEDAQAYNDFHIFSFKTSALKLLPAQISVEAAVLLGGIKFYDFPGVIRIQHRHPRTFPKLTL